MDVHSIQLETLLQKKNKYMHLLTECKSPGILYYRVKSVDFDGRIKYSGIIKVVIETIVTLTVSRYIRRLHRAR